MQCPKCKGKEYAKNGTAHGMQRYLCKTCGCTYTKSTPRGYSANTRNKAFDLSAQGTGIRGIARVLNISHMTVARWDKSNVGRVQKLLRQQNPRPEEICIMEIAELCTFVGRKSLAAGRGWLLIEVDGAFWPAKSALVVNKLY